MTGSMYVRFVPPLGQRSLLAATMSEEVCIQLLLEVNGSIVAGRVLDERSSAFGYDAQADAFGDMIEKGIIDPAKVVRIALQDAASVAGMMITTEAGVTDVPKRDGDQGQGNEDVQEGELDIGINEAPRRRGESAYMNPVSAPPCQGASRRVRAPGPSRSG